MLRGEIEKIINSFNFLEDEPEDLADKVCLLLIGRLEKIYWVKSESKVLDDIDQLIKELKNEI